MLHNRFAGEALKKVDRLYENGIEMNGQIVLCKGVNDGEELRCSIEALGKYMPVLQSVSVVPVGLTKFREGLYPLEPFNKEDAGEVLDMIDLFPGWNGGTADFRLSGALGTGLPCGRFLPDGR